MPTPVNVATVRTEDRHRVIYVGRGTPDWPKSPLGNPFSHRERSKARFQVKTVEEAIAAFRIYLWAALHDHEWAAVDCYEPVRRQQVTRVTVILRRHQVLEVFRKIKEDSLLGCHCKPDKCHALIIAKAWEWWRNQHDRSSQNPAQHREVDSVVGSRH